MSVTLVKKNDLAYLTADSIPVKHCFTTRKGGVSGSYLESLNIGCHRGDSREKVETNYAILADALDFELQNLVLTHQVHGDVVRVVTKKDACGIDHHEYPECDALATCEPGTVLGIFTADCTPILLWDSVTGAVGAAHAGWRGTAQDIAGKTVQAMVAQFGCNPGNIHAAIGPNIGPCCFETHADVPEAMAQAFGDAAKKWIRPVNDKYYVNLKEINALALRRAGVEQVEISELCTSCRPDLFWSHRVTGGQRGSQGALIVCEGGRG